jgi:glycosyltransferase involved in cell wall biosynthesis
MFKTLYICYFSMRQPLVQTQVLPYLREIVKDDVKVYLLTFEPEKWTPAEVDETRRKLAGEGITWDFLAYHKTPSVPATLYDIFCGTWFALRLIRREKIDLIHARVHVPAIMGLLVKKLSRQKPKLLFDIRGFTPEEYTDAGVWKPNGSIYNVFKWVERKIFRGSDGFVVLTEKAREVLFPESAAEGFDKLGRPVEVIPCCVDFEKRFGPERETIREQARAELNLDGRLVIMHLGALGGLYLTGAIADFLEAARMRRPETFAMFLTQTDPDLIVPLLREKGFTGDDFFVGRVAPGDVYRYLSASDVSLSFVKAGYATISRSPTKIPEYLAAGLPIVSNRGVGDVDELISTEKVGVLLDLDPNGYAGALEEALLLKDEAGFAARCIACAKKRFDLEQVGGSRYRSLYRKLLGKRDADQ